MRTNLLALAALSAALFVGGCAVPNFGGSGASATGSSAAAEASIEGSTWVGTDSDGDYYEYTFLKGGQLRFATRSGGKLETHQDAGDYWAQNGKVVLITTTKFTTRQGLINGKRMQGDAWNVRGQRWTWLGDKR